MLEITPRQSAILGYVMSQITTEQRPPTMAEIAKQFGFASGNAAFEHCQALERAGYLVNRGGTRGLFVTDKAFAEKVI